MEFLLWAVLALLIFAVAAHYVERGIATARMKLADSGDMPKWVATDGYVLDVVGESHYRASLLKILHGVDARELKAIAVLVPYKSRHDKHAVRVEIRSHIVGHLSRDDARAYRKRLAKKFGEGKVAAADALIGSGLEAGERGPIGVRLAVSL